ncbi:STAS domain-containing protein [Simplicispira psychrophila]|uniref:STAS domain-containing protein n=1 Tax=Simplicispira psychrophila TaxID=80882 RepID=UPI000488854B|nr:STAS domain-containing protein [Simplicispira psychrophila]
MSKEDSSSGGLLSKVVRFVRNPTVNWNDLDSIQADRESQYSKQVLKEMIERKRRNDFVRRREFDQLRKLRQRGPLTSQRTEEPGVRPSFFQSSLTSPLERAVTIKKIDEIEAQMSMQWWKSKPQGDASARGTAAPQRPEAVVETNFAATALLSLPMELLAPAPPLFADDSSFVNRVDVLPDLSLALPGGRPSDLNRLGAVPVPVAEMEEFVHEPDLEEAAIRFANGDYAGAEAGLLGVLAQHVQSPPEQQFDIWMTLFDLYRATGQQERFDTLALDFAARFSRSAPLWFSIPEQLGLASAAPSEPMQAPARRDFSWNAPAALTAQSVASLHASLERAASPWVLVWSRLRTLEDAALVALEKEFTRWAEQKVQIVFSGAEVLHALLEAHTQSGDRSGNAVWWGLRMAALRFMNRSDEFELVALDYCVTYEVSPPSWVAPRCTYSDDPKEGAAASPSAPVQELLAKPNWSAATELAPLSLLSDMAQTLPTLSGHIENDATAALDALAGGAPAGEPLVIDCGRLIRMDFSAAGSVLNWAAEQQGKGRDVRFQDLHRLVAVFFNVIGISEHAWVVPRKN